MRIWLTAALLTASSVACTDKPGPAEAKTAPVKATPATPHGPDTASPPKAAPTSDVLRQAAIDGLAKCRWLPGRGVALDCKDLNDFRTTPSTLAQIRVILRDADPKVRYLGVERLRVHSGHALIGDLAVATLLVETAERDASLEVAVYAARLLVWVDTARTGLAGRIAKLAQSHALPEVRTVALQWMGSKRDPEFRAALLAVTSEPKPARSAARAAWSALAAQPDTAVCDHAFAHFKTPNPSAAGGPSKVMVQVACSPQQEAFMAATRERLTAGTLDAPMARLLLKLTATRKVVNQMAARELVHDVAQATGLAAEVRILAFSWIWHKDKWARKLFRDAGTDTDPKVREFIASTLKREPR